MENDKNTTPNPTQKPEQKKGLGRGLAALLGGDEESPFSKAPVKQAPVPEAAPPVVEQKAEAPEATVEELRAAGYRVLNLAIDKVKANEEQPRQHFSDARLQELAESICEQGLIQPITVRMLPDQTYQIVAGERRWRACKMLGMSEIPAIVRKEDEQPEKAELASVIENIQRVELNPVELADAYSKILKTFSFTQEELAKKLGVSRVSVANTLRLQKLPKAVKDSIVSGKISEGHARALLTLENEDEMVAVAQEIVDQGLNVREVEAKVRARIQGPTAQPVESQKSGPIPTNGAPRDAAPKSPETLAAEEELRTLFGTKALIRGSTRGGVIELFYSNEDSLHRLLHQLRQSRS